jgi:hypothetical protein
MTDPCLLSTLDSPANDVAPPASAFRLAAVTTPPLTRNRAAHHAGARSPAMQTATAVQSRTTRTHRSTTPETAMIASTSVQSTSVATLTLVHSARAAIELDTSPGSTRRRPFLLASQVSDVAEKELDFFFAQDGDDDASVLARRVIANRIATLSDRDQDALSLYFDPEPWPESIRREGVDYRRGYALVLAHASPYERWPDGPQRQTYLRQVSLQLLAAVETHGPRVLCHLTRRSEWTFAAALRAYVKARGRAPSVLGPQGRSRKEAP